MGYHYELVRWSVASRRKYGGEATRCTVGSCVMPVHADERQVGAVPYGGAMLRESPCVVGVENR
jgi:hypothetical protein